MAEGEVEQQGNQSELLSLLNKAIARELQVCIQYMFQHSIGAGPAYAVSGKTRAARQSKFVASHSPPFLPGATLRKIAIAEMRHAEAIAERVVSLDEEPTTLPGPVTIGKTIREMLELDKEQGSSAIEMYRHIVRVAERERDSVTKALFERILSEEEGHHRVFAKVLGEE
jgi:bacterioferritin